MPTASLGRLMMVPVPGHVEEALRNVVAARSAEFGIEDVHVEPGEDHDGDPVIYVTLQHRLLDDPIDLSETFRLDRELRDLAWSEGERRFVHVRHQFDEKQSVTAHK